MMHTNMIQLWQADGFFLFKSTMHYQLVEERGLRMSSLAVSSDRL